MVHNGNLSENTLSEVSQLTFTVTYWMAMLASMISATVVGTLGVCTCTFAVFIKLRKQILRDFFLFFYFFISIQCHGV
jgi:hypothetical protein